MKPPADEDDKVRKISRGLVVCGRVCRNVGGLLLLLYVCMYVYVKIRRHQHKHTYTRILHGC